MEHFRSGGNAAGARPFLGSNKARNAAGFDGNLGLCLPIFQALLPTNPTVAR